MADEPPSISIEERHQRHYTYCNCLADSGECCVPTCPCHPPRTEIVLCTDPDCDVAWAFRDPPAEHYHPRPHGPELPADKRKAS